MQQQDTCARPKRRCCVNIAIPLILCRYIITNIQFTQITYHFVLSIFYCSGVCQPQMLSHIIIYNYSQNLCRDHHWPTGLKFHSIVYRIHSDPFYTSHICHVIILIYPYHAFCYTAVKVKISQSIFMGLLLFSETVHCSQIFRGHFAKL